MHFLVFPPFYPPHIGGLELFAHEFNIRLAKNGHRVTVFYPELPKFVNASHLAEMPTALHLFPYPAFEIIPNYPCPKFWSPKFWNLLRRASANKPDVIVSHTRFFLISVFALGYARWRHVPLIHFEHGSSPVQSDSPLIITMSRLFDATLGRFVIRGASKVISISGEVRRFVKERWSLDSLVLYRGFEANEIAGIAPSARPKKSPETLRLICCGRLISGKGVDTLLEALEYVTFQEWELLIVGDGPARSALEMRAQSHLKGRVHFLGQKSWTETISLIKSADVFINPSQSEGLPTAVAEASLAGKAVIATDVGGTKELFPIENVDLLVPPKDSAALASAIEKLAAHQDRISSAGVVAQRFVANRYTWGKTIAAFSNILDAL